MSRLKKRFVLASALIMMLPALSGCDLFDKLKARDHLNKGVTAYKSEKWSEATEHFQEAIRLDAELTAARLYLATTYRAQYVPGIPTEENLQRAEMAIKTFKEVLEKDVANVNAMANIAGLYSSMEEPDLAKEWYRKRMEVEPENPEPHYGIGTINWKLVHDVTGLNGENAENLEEEKRQEVAQLVESGVESLRRALELNPNYSEAMQYLNLLYRERSYLAQDDEEKLKWQREADKLALQALELKRKQEEEAERARRTFGGSAPPKN